MFRKAFVFISVIISIILFYFSDGTIQSNALMSSDLWFGLTATNIATIPFISVIKSVKKDEAKPIDYIGLLGEVVLETSPTQIGQIEVNHKKRNLILTVKTMQECQNIIKKGIEVVISDHNEDRTLFFVRPSYIELPNSLTI